MPLHGKRSEKLTRGRAATGLRGSRRPRMAEVEAEKDEQAATSGPRRAGALPGAPSRQPARGRCRASSEVIEPDSLLCPCGCGADARDRRGSHGAAGHRAGAAARDRHRAPEIRLPDLHRRRHPGAGAQRTSSIGGLPTEGAIAHVLVSKYADHLPLYRQSRILGTLRHRDPPQHPGRLGRDRRVPPQAGGGPAGRTSEGVHASCSWTRPRRRSSIPGAVRTKTGYLWALARDDRAWGGDDPPGVVYFYAPDRAGENAETFLTGLRRHPADSMAIQGYNRLTRPIAKGRRSDPGGTLLGACAAQAEGGVRPRRLRDRRRGPAPDRRGLQRSRPTSGASAPGQRLSARQARTAPLVAAFREWLQEQRLRVSAKSRLGEKLAYIHHHWDGLQTFLADGRVEINSNRRRKPDQARLP